MAERSAFEMRSIEEQNRQREQSSLTLTAQAYLPAVGQIVVFDSEAMILRRNVTFRGTQVNTWLVRAAITVFHLVCCSPNSQAQKLIPETNTEEWNFFVFASTLVAFSLPWFQANHLFDAFDGLCAQLRITRTIAHKYTIELANKVFNISIVGDYYQLHTPLQEFANNIVLHPAVVC